MRTPAQPMEHLFEQIRHLPADGIAAVEDFVNVLQARNKARQATANQSMLADFPVDNLGEWPEGLSLRREEMYGDDGR